jgi:hypothetical protein
MPIEAIAAAASFAAAYQLRGTGGGDTAKAVRPSGKPEKAGKGNGDQLSDQQKAEVARLKARDTQVKQHEQAHVAAGGGVVRGGPTYEYQTGPDGKQYAVGGEVSIDTSPVKGNPQATIAKMETVKRAALAPADPSAQDRSVASQAAQEESVAQQELAAGAASGSAKSPAPHQAMGTIDKKAEGNPLKTAGYTAAGAMTPPPARASAPAIDLFA